MKKIILTETQFEKIVNSFITERLGVPENLVDVSASVYEQIISKIENLNYNNLNYIDDDKRIYEMTVEGNYEIKDQQYSKVNVKLSLEPIDHPEVMSPVLKGFHNEGGTRPEPNFRYLVNKKTVDEVTIGINFYVPEDWNGPMSELSEILKNDENQTISSTLKQLAIPFNI